MKIILLLFIVTILTSISKDKVEGEYSDKFGNKLTLNADSTFIHKWHIDLSGGWSKGKWRLKNDTLYFTVIPIFDTLRISGKKDSLVLSQTQNPRVITFDTYFISLLASGGQNKMKIDEKLYYKNDRLYRIDSKGKLELKKISGIMDANIKSHTWFEKRK